MCSTVVPRLLTSPHSIPWPDPAKDRGISRKNFNRIPQNYNGITQQQRKIKFVCYYGLYFCGFQKPKLRVNIPKTIGVHSQKKKKKEEADIKLYSVHCLFIQQPFKPQCHPDTSNNIVPTSLCTEGLG